MTKKMVQGQIFINILSGYLMLSVFVLSVANATVDKYEPDNTWQDANVILINDGRPKFQELSYEWYQTHNFYQTGDVDWVKFYAVRDEHYTISVKDPCEKCDVVIEIYDRDGETLINPPGTVNRCRLPGGEYCMGTGEENARFKCKEDGIYYAKISQCETSLSNCHAEYGENSSYTLMLTIPVADHVGYLYGKVIPPDVNAIITTRYVDTIPGESKSGTLTLSNGFYNSPHLPGSYILSVIAECYEPYEDDIYVVEFPNSTEIDDIELIPDPECEVERPGWFKINGTVLNQSEIPLCAMVLANGQYMFSCAGDGRYELTVPLDENGEISLFSFVDGFAPFNKILTPENAVNLDIHMSACEDCSKMNLIYDTADTDSGWIRITGSVLNESGTPLCAMVLANGQHMFSCAGDGKYDLEVPLDENGEITLFGFCDGLQPFKETFIP